MSNPIREFIEIWKQKKNKKVLYKCGSFKCSFDDVLAMMS